MDPQRPSELRRFAVRARACEVRHGLVVHEADAHAAALAFVETGGCDLEVESVEVFVRDLESGWEGCFRVDLEALGAKACE